MFALDDALDDRCPVPVYKMYRLHRPPDLNTPDSRFYLRPLILPETITWCSHQLVGKDKIGRMMKDMATDAELEGILKIIQLGRLLQQVSFTVV